MIGMDEIKNWSANFNQARHSLFILDSCFSGLAGEQAKGDEAAKIYMDDLLQPGHFLITAGSAQQESYASVQRWGGSLFTYAFLQGVNGAADSGTPQFPPDGVISLTKLYDYIRRRISAERAQNPQMDQTPLRSDLTPKSLGEPFFIADATKAQPRFSPNSNISNVGEVESKGSASVIPKGPSLLTINKVDELYGAGLKDFPTRTFGRTLGELFPQFSWSALPQASEFQRSDVRYFWVKIRDALPTWTNNGCVSPTSYVVFFFNQQKLFRISIRLLDEGVCTSHRTWFAFFANSVGANIGHTASLEYFDVLARKVQFIGVNTPTRTIVDIIDANSVWMMTEQEWLSFLGVS